MSIETYRHQLKTKYELWYKSFFWAVAFLVAWIVAGTILAGDYFDRPSFETIKVLQKDSALGYLAAILAVQIPLLILFLEKMANSGYIYRKLFPRVVKFREIITLLLVGGTLVLISPRASYLYLPILVLFLVNVVAIFRAITTIFQPENYDNNIKDYLEKSVDKSFSLMLQHRIQNNDFYKRLGEFEDIKRSYLGIGKKKGLRSIDIRSDGNGFIKNIDLEALAKIRDKEFNVIGDTETTQAGGVDQLEVEININVSPSTSVRRDASLVTIHLPDEYRSSSRLQKQVLKCFNIVPSGEVDVRWFEELLNEFDQQLNKAISEKNTILINQTFSQLQVVLDRVDKFIKSKQEDDYKLNQAFEEINRFAGDELSKGLDRLYEILSDLSTKSIRNDQPDINREIVRFIYGNSLDCVHTKNITSIARYDRLLTNAVALFIYSNAWNKSLTASQRELRNMLFDRLKEHTDILLYEIKRIEDGEVSDDGTLPQWFERRLNDLRTLSLAAVRNKLDVPFTKLLEILQRTERNRHFDRLDPTTYTLIKCNILMVAAFVHHRGEMDTEYGKALMDIVQKWTNQELMQTLLECTGKNYADKWRVNTFELVADGEMHEVPDYDMVLRSLWVDIMLKKNAIPQRTEIYGDHKVFEQTLFFTHGGSKDEDNPLLKMIDEKDPNNTKKLKDLVNQLIAIRRNWEHTKLGEENLDTEKINKFKDNVIKAYNEASLVGKAFPKQSFISDKSKKTEGFLQTGINQIFDKEAFISDWHIGYGNDYFGEQLGRQIAENQDRKVLATILAKPTVRKDLKKLLKKLSDAREKKWLVVVVGMSAWGVEYRLSDFVHVDNSSGDLYFKDVEQTLPVQNLHTDGVNDGIYFIDASKLGTITAKSYNFDPPVKVEVTAYSHDDDLMNELINASPDWLRERGSEREQREFLRTKVRLLVERVFKYDPPTKPSVFYFEMNEDF